MAFQQRLVQVCFRVHLAMVPAMVKVEVSHVEVAVSPVENVLAWDVAVVAVDVEVVK